MNPIDQNTAIASLQKALVPAPALIDGRSEKDWLYFLARFARLINFYDTQNNHSGSWEPMLLKDPVFLLAVIGYTDVTEMHTLYLDTCAKLQQLLQLPPNTDDDDIAASFNQLFDQLTSVFMYIKRWVYYMQRCSDEYELKTYIAVEVKNTFSRYFWALLSLRQNLYLSGMIPGIKPVDTSNFYWFPQYDELIWKQNKDKDPYWQVLNLKHPIRENTLQDLFDSICSAGDKTFHFLQTIVLQANTTFNTIQHSKSHYPDTTLLRTFIHLLQVQQHQMNTIAGKHLQFYYRTILQQREQPALPDKVFLCATLTQKKAPFSLPGGTLFNAGLNADKKQVLFFTTADVVLSPATITQAHTLTAKELPDSGASYFLETIPTPGLIKKDETGKVLAWDTFGNTRNNTNRIEQCLAFASPLLLLREGERTIGLTLDFAAPVPAWLLQHARYYLSTPQNWVEVTGFIGYHPPLSGMASHAAIGILLPVTAPPITAFTKNPDGISSNWPMLKIVFTYFYTPVEPPLITQLQLEVTVKKMRSVQLYNDYGSLGAQAPFALFGPAPAVNSHFIAGSDEVFSKPLTGLQLTFNWDALPAEKGEQDNPFRDDVFSVYYQPYNQYVNDRLMPETRTEQLKKKNWITRWFKRDEKSDEATKYYNTPFNDECFGVTFQLLQKQSWNAFRLIGPQPRQPRLLESETLYAVDRLPDNPVEIIRIQPSSVYNLMRPLSPDECDATIQLTPLTFTAASTSGFMRMNLAEPVYGFGAGLYPAVVTQAAYINATQIAQNPQKPATAIVVNPPFTPKVASLEINYAAKTNCLKGDYPFEYFQYSVFGNYKLPYKKDYQYIIGKQPEVSLTGATGLPLYPPLLYKGYLLLEIDNLVPATATSLYFELTGSSVADPASIDYFYISSTGWKSLPVLADSTNGLSCSGIVTVNIPADIASQSLVMPGGKYWIAIATNRAPGSISRTVLLSTNGFVVQRTADSLPLDGTTPELAAQIITRTQFTVPQIATVVQPFASFGGKAPEDEAAMNLRVSSRLKTKDRAVCSSDYAGLIRQHFPDVYYSKTVFSPSEKSTGVYAIRSFKSWTEPNAFIPLLTTCRQAEIQQFLEVRTSAFARVALQHFNLQYVQVATTIVISPGYESAGIREKLNHLLNLFLSPWISTHVPQAIIDQPITDASVARCIGSIAGIKSIGSLSFNTWLAGMDPVKVQTVTPFTASSLLVSSMDHLIECIETI